ncbi:MAG: c-type cytochrome domain-containing protein [Planctomycetaceae bacterium]
MFGQRFPGLLLCGLLCGSSLFVAGAPALVLAEDKPEEAKKITYDDHILPIFRQRCGSCHNANDQKGGLALDTYAALMQGGGSGDVVEAGDAGASYLYMVVTHDSEPYMPPNQPKMPDAELALIREWIELGALENKGSKAVKKKQSDLAKIEISTTRAPADAPVLPPREPAESRDNDEFAERCDGLGSQSLGYPGGSLRVRHKCSCLTRKPGCYRESYPFPRESPGVEVQPQWSVATGAGGGQGGASGKVKLVWDIKTGARVAELGDEYDSVLAADISADHSLVVLSGPKRMVRVYSLQSGELLYELKKHTDWVLAAEFSPDGVLLATADRSYRMFLWKP